MTQGKPYVDWVDDVGRALGIAWQSSGRSLDGLSREQIMSAIQIDIDQVSTECVDDALRDLVAMGLADDEGATFGGATWQPTQEGRKFPDVSLRTTWGDIFKIFLDVDQLAFLTHLCELSEERFEQFARVNWVQASEVVARLGEDWEDQSTRARGYAIVQRLGDLGLVRDQGAMGGHLPAHPTYAGIVRATQAEPNEWRSLVEQLLSDWETTNVDFKRELHLERDAEKAELVRDVLALANTKSSGRRFIVIGFDDKTRSFGTSFDGGITQERVEQILQAYAPPAPQVRLRTCPWPGGTIGILEVFRDALRVPYVATKSIAKLQGGVTYVRHGSHTEPATPREQESLLDEGAVARGGAPNGDVADD